MIREVGGGHVGGVLERHHDARHPHGYIVLILDDRHRLAVRAEARHCAGQPGQRQAAGQAVRQHHRQRQQFGRFIGGVPDYHALVARTDGVGVASCVQRVIDCGLDVGALGMDQALDLKIFRIVPGVFQRVAGQFAHVRQRGGADLARQEDVAFGCQHFAGHTGVAVKSQTAVQHSVRDLVAEFVGMAACYGFSGIKMRHTFLLIK